MRPSKPILHGLATLAVLAAGILCSATPALALETDFKETIGAGVFTRESPLPSVAVNNVTGDVYADNFETKKILRFEASGQLVGALPGEFPSEGRSLDYLAVDNSPSPSAGDLYVAEHTENAVVLLDPSGTPVDFAATAPYINGSQLTGTPTGEAGAVVPFSNLGNITVDPAGNVYVIDGEVVDVFNDEGTYQRQLTPGGGLAAVAVATDGTTYLLAQGVVDVFNAKGEAQGSITGTGPAGEVPFNGPTGVAVDNSTSVSDPAAGDVYVADGGAGTSAVDVFNAKGEYQEQNRITRTPSGPFRSLSGVAVDGSGDIYVSDEITGLVDVFTPTIITLPDVTTGEASSVTHTTATISGSITPDGLDTTCYVEYNTKTAPCEHPTISGSEGEVQVKANLTGLSSRSTGYSYRVCGVNINKVPNCGVTKSFSTLPDLPAVVSESASFVTPTEAVLAGAVNPETGLTTYHFAYGPSAAYGLRLPGADLTIGSGTVSLAVQGLSVVELQPGTTYHYAIIATNAAGTTYGPDQTFTTPAGPVPSVATGGVSGVSQTAATVSGVVNPGGVQTTYEFDLGTDTAYGTRVFGSAGQGSAAESFTAAFQSLTPSTTYHYRLVAINAYGTTYGADETFTTAGVTTSLLTVPPALPLVAIPNVVFPGEPGTTNTTSTKKALTNAQKLAAALKVCKKEAKKKQANCVKQARQRYSSAKKAKKSTNGERSV